MLQEHLEAAVADENKIVFIVPTVALVEQQFKQFKKYLPRNTKIIPIFGDSQADNKVPMQMQLPEFNVFVMTPQILVDALETEKAWLGDLFTMVIFDECHHTTKGHPYNAIMSHYLNRKLNAQKQNEGINLPQVGMSLLHDQLSYIFSISSINLIILYML